MKFCLLAPLACLCLLFTAFQGSELIVTSAKVRATDHNDLNGFAQKINQAVTWSFGHNARALGLSATIPSGILKTQNARLSKQAQYEYYQQALALLKRATRENPRLASLYHEQAVLAEYAQKHLPDMDSGLPTPRELFETANRIDPIHANTRIRLAQAMIKDGEEKQAYELLKGGLYWPYYNQDPVPYFKMTASMALQHGDIKTQKEALKKAQKFIERQRQ